MYILICLASESRFGPARLAASRVAAGGRGRLSESPINPKICLTPICSGTSTRIPATVCDICSSIASPSEARMPKASQLRDSVRQRRKRGFGRFLLRAPRPQASDLVSGRTRHSNLETRRLGTRPINGHFCQLRRKSTETCQYFSRQDPTKTGRPNFACDPISAVLLADLPSATPILRCLAIGLSDA